MSTAYATTAGLVMDETARRSIIVTIVLCAIKRQAILATIIKTEPIIAFAQRTTIRVIGVNIFYRCAIALTYTSITVVEMTDYTKYFPRL